MGFIPLSGQYTALEEAKLRRVKLNKSTNRLEKELSFSGTWYMVYHLRFNQEYSTFLLSLLHCSRIMRSFWL